MSSTLRCLRLLELIASEPFEWTLTEIAVSMGITKGTAHRLIATLREGGYIGQTDQRRYFVEGKTFAIGTAFLRHSRAYRAAFPVMHELGVQTKGMVHLTVLDQDSLLFLRSYGQPSSYYLYADAGDRRPVLCNAGGKAILAHRPESELRRIFALGCERYTAKTIVSLPALLRELALVRSRGYAVNDEEWSVGLRAVAGPIWNERRETVAAIVMGSPTPLMTTAELRRCGGLVRDAGIRISAQLGFRPSSLRHSLKV